MSFWQVPRGICRGRMVQSVNSAGFFSGLLGCCLDMEGPCNSAAGALDAEQVVEHALQAWLDTREAVLLPELGLPVSCHSRYDGSAAGEQRKCFETALPLGSPEHPVSLGTRHAE